MAITSRQLAQILVEQASNASEKQLPRILKEFVKLLEEQRLLTKWRDIEREIDHVWKKKFGASTVTVVSAHELTSETRKAVEKIAPGAELRTRVDNRLIGGAIIRVDDQRADGSIAGSLRRLKASLQYGK